MKFLPFILLIVAVAPTEQLYARHVRDASQLAYEEKLFAERLSLKERKVFCGQFSAAMRKLAIDYTEKELTPDEAVLKVMLESGLSSAKKMH